MTIDGVPPWVKEVGSFIGGLVTMGGAALGYTSRKHKELDDKMTAHHATAMIEIEKVETGLGEALNQDRQRVDARIEAARKETARQFQVIQADQNHMRENMLKREDLAGIQRSIEGLSARLDRKIDHTS